MSLTMVLGGPGSSGGLFKTGQATSYQSGDDGDLQKGIDRNFLFVPRVGNTDIIINGKTCALANNTTKDLVNNLEWSYVPQSDIGPDSDGNLYWVDATNGEDIWGLWPLRTLRDLPGLMTGTIQT